MGDIRKYEFQGDFRCMGETLKCGQAFRWRVYGDTAAGIVGTPKGQSIALITWDATNLAIAVDAKQEHLNEAFWRRYFELNGKSEWEQLRERIEELRPEQGDATTELCLKAVDNVPGMTILLQDPWECLVSFIISQRNNIPRIEKCVEQLCWDYGEELVLGSLSGYGFPSVDRLASISEVELLDVGLGYRARYVKNAAAWCLRNPNWLKDLEGLDTKELKEQLKRLNGVGDKVASCVALFGYGRHEEFPIDIWMQRVVDRYFKGRSPAKKFDKLAGLLQQCLFIAARSELI